MELLWNMRLFGQQLKLRVGAHPYLQTPDDDPAVLYQNVLVALDRGREINIGQPSAHAYWLGACGIKKAETIVQVGVGTGCYTAILAHLVLLAA